MASRHRLAWSVTLLLILMSSSLFSAVTAADFPTKSITLVIPFPPGGGTDTIGRPLASVAHQHLGQAMVVVNKAGGGGAVGSQFVANAKPDGYTVLYGMNALSEMPHIDALLGRPIAFKKDQFIPIGQFAVNSLGIMVPADSRWQTLQDFITEAKQQPEAFQYASAGVYSTTHIMWERFLRAAGIAVRHMPTTGGGPVMTAVLGKHADIGHCVVPSVCAAQVGAGKVRLLAMSAPERHPNYPDVPTLRELGYDVVHVIWQALMAPAGTPPEVVAKLRQGLKEMVADAAFLALMDKLGERVQYLSGEDFERFWEQDYQQNGTVLQQIIQK